MPAFPRQRFRFHPATGTDGPGRFGVPEAPRSRGRPIIVRRRGPDGGKTSALRAGVPAPEGGVGAGEPHARGTGPRVRGLGAGDPLPGTSGRREAGPTVAEREGLRRRSAPCWRFEPRAPPPGRPAMRPPPPASGQGRGFGHEAELPRSPSRPPSCTRLARNDDGETNEGRTAQDLAAVVGACRARGSNPRARWWRGRTTARTTCTRSSQAATKPWIRAGSRSNGALRNRRAAARTRSTSGAPAHQRNVFPLPPSLPGASFAR